MLVCCVFQPERIDPPDPMNPDYDVRADVWSLGITLVSNNSFSFPVALYFNSTKRLLLHAMLTLHWYIVHAYFREEKISMRVSSNAPYKLHVCK